MKDERHLDALESIQVLQTSLAGHPASNDTAEGRMLHQLDLLKMLVDRDCPLPINQDLISTLRYVYTEGGLGADSWPTYTGSRDYHMRRLLKIFWYGSYLLKPAFFHVPIADINGLLRLLEDNYNSVIDDIRVRRRNTPSGRSAAEELDSLLATVGGGMATFQLAVDLRKMRSELENRTLLTPMSMPERAEKYPGFDTCYSLSLFQSLPPIYRFIIRIDVMIIEGIRPGPDGTAGFNMIDGEYFP
jgi:hypothetical protein